MKFYTVSNEYISYLKTIDSKVPDNYSGTRPYVGILLEINGHKYLAPLTSYKPKQDEIADNKITVFKLYEKGNPSNKLGMISLNNMIPIIESEISMINFSEQNKKYATLLTSQINFISSNQDDIVKKAEKLYKVVTVSKTEHFCKISCNFTLLEKNYKNFT